MKTQAAKNTAIVLLITRKKDNGNLSYSAARFDAKNAEAVKAGAIKLFEKAESVSYVTAPLSAAPIKAMKVMQLKGESLGLVPFTNEEKYNAILEAATNVETLKEGGKRKVSSKKQKEAEQAEDFQELAKEIMKGNKLSKAPEKMSDYELLKELGQERLGKGDRVSYPNNDKKKTRSIGIVVFSSVKKDEVKVQPTTGEDSLTFTRGELELLDTAAELEARKVAHEKSSAKKKAAEEARNKELDAKAKKMAKSSKPVATKKPVRSVKAQEPEKATPKRLGINKTCKVKFDGKWYKGKITKKMANDKWKVLFDDGDHFAVKKAELVLI